MLQTSKKMNKGLIENVTKMTSLELSMFNFYMFPNTNMEYIKSGDSDIYSPSMTMIPLKIHVAVWI